MFTATKSVRRYLPRVFTTWSNLKCSSQSVYSNHQHFKKLFDQDRKKSIELMRIDVRQSVSHGQRECSEFFQSTNSWPTSLGHKGFAPNFWRTLYGQKLSA